MNIPREDTGYTQQDNEVVKNMTWKNNQKARQTQTQINNISVAQPMCQLQWNKSYS